MPQDPMVDELLASRHESDAVSSVQVGTLAEKIADSLGAVLQGKADAIEATITTLFAGGHLLLEDVPGVGKTTLAAALARSIDAGTQRIQFTADLQPTDITGLSIYDLEQRDFEFHPGPIFTNIVVGDEVNRATPKTQSALLEAMGERAVTIDGVTRHLPDLFLVVATQNPHDMEGTFPLPEAQRDRFMTRISLGYPNAEAEVAMIAARESGDPAYKVTPVASVGEVLAAQRMVEQVLLAPEVARYLVDIVAGTRTHQSVAFGASPRATLHLGRMARARAAMHGRDYVSPDDIAQLATMVLPHRIEPNGRFASATDSYRVATDIVSDVVAHARVG